MNSNPTCTKEDVDSLKETKKSLTEAAKVVDNALKVVEDNYEKETGVTLSPADLTLILRNMFVQRIKQYTFFVYLPYEEMYL